MSASTATRITAPFSRGIGSLWHRSCHHRASQPPRFASSPIPGRFDGGAPQAEPALSADHRPSDRSGHTRSGALPGSYDKLSRKPRYASATWPLTVVTTFAAGREAMTDSSRSYMADSSARPTSRCSISRSPERAGSRSPERAGLPAARPRSAKRRSAFSLLSSRTTSWKSAPISRARSSACSMKASRPRNWGITTSYPAARWARAAASAIALASSPARGSSRHRPIRLRTRSMSRFSARGCSSTYIRARVDLPHPGGPLSTISRGTGQVHERRDEARPCGSCLRAGSFVAVNGVRGESREAHGDVLRPPGSRRAVPHPFARFRMDPLAGVHRHPAGLGFHDEGPAQHNRELVELRALPWLGPARRAAHAGYADAVLARAGQSHVLIDQLGRLARGGHPARFADQLRHARQYLASHARRAGPGGVRQPRRRPAPGRRRPGSVRWRWHRTTEEGSRCLRT